MKAKICSKCKVETALDNFSPVKRDDDGAVLRYASWCKVCKKNAELERRKLSGIKEKILLKVFPDTGEKECGECHKILKVLEFSPSSRGSLGVSSYCKQCVNEKRKSTPEDDRKLKGRLATQKYRDKNRLRWKAMHRIHQFNRRSKIKAADDGTVTDSFLKELFKKEKCCWCNKVMNESEKTIEHIKELSRGGLQSASNIDLACLSCNSSRKNRNGEK